MGSALRHHLLKRRVKRRPPLPSLRRIGLPPVHTLLRALQPIGCRRCLLAPEEEASYYVSRLSDRRFVSSYGDRDNPRPWYIAAEKLGEIGLPAVPLLFARLNTSDEYEQMLVLYALQLATQDPQLMVRTSGDYVQLGVVLDPAHNAENVVTAQQWWQQHASQLNL